MITSALDILYISLAVGFIVLVIFLSITLLYTIFILRDVSSVTDDVKEITGRVNEVVITPLNGFHFLIEQMRPYLENAFHMIAEKAMSKKGKKSK